MGIMSGLRSIFGTQIYYIGGVSDNPHVVDLDTAAVYRSQPNLRAVVSYLADNVADIPLKVYTRRSDTDRERVTDSAAAKLLKRPSPYMTQFELMQTTASNVLLYGHSLWLVLADMNSDSGWAIYPVPPLWVLEAKSDSAWYPSSFVIQAGANTVEVPADKCILFRNYNPESPWKASSPVTALKDTLTEQVEANRYRLSVWKNGGRMSAYITRPKDVKPWSPEQAERFKKAMKDHYSGDGASNGGGMPVLEDGMEIKAAQFSAKEAQWAEAKKFSREEVASVYHVNPGLIWHDQSMTYASAKDNARALYSETLSPILTMLEQRINASLLPMLKAKPDEYAEFEFKKKLQGSFEEQAQVIQSSVGAPWLTRNEARAMQNLPAIEGGDTLIVPMNVLEGNYQQAATGYNSGTVEAKAAPQFIELKAAPTQEQIDRVKAVLVDYFEHQGKTIPGKVGTGREWWQTDRWNDELAAKLLPLIDEQVREAARIALKELDLPAGFFNFAICAEYCKTMAEKRAENINAKTKAKCTAAIAAGTALKEVFEDAIAHRAEPTATSLVTHCNTFANEETVTQAKQNGAAISNVEKTWHVHNANPRPSHAALNGETVGIDERYSNGLRYPGDINGTAEDTCGCTCTSDLVIEKRSLL